MTSDDECVAFLQWALPRLRLRWAGFRKVRRQVCKRMRRRLNELGLKTLDQYRSLLETDGAEWAILDDLCHITISRLYRDKYVFDLLGARILPELGREASGRARAVRCWCAGCASGEEVYTLRILWDLEVHSTVPQVHFELIGTDVEDAVLERAAAGCFSAGSMTDAPARWRDVAFERVGRLYCVRFAHREGLMFLHQDIRTEVPAGPFDLILCRNLVFTYFEPELQRATLGRIASELRDGGYLVIGAHEQLAANGGLFEPVAGCREIFRKVRPSLHRYPALSSAEGSPT